MPRIRTHSKFDYNSTLHQMSDEIQEIISPEDAAVLYGMIKILEGKLKLACLSRSATGNNRHTLNRLRYDVVQLGLKFRAFAALDQPEPPYKKLNP